MSKKKQGQKPKIEIDVPKRQQQEVKSYSELVDMNLDLMRELRELQYELINLYNNKITSEDFIFLN